MVILGLSCSVYNLIKNDYMIPAQLVVVVKKAGYKEIKMAIDEGVVMNVPYHKDLDGKVGRGCSAFSMGG